ncbi:MAG: hypothetical protein ABJA02_12375 [Acidobacteriota bacterium]
MKTRITNILPGLIAVMILCIAVWGCRGSQDQLGAADRAISDIHSNYNNDKFEELAEQRDQKMKDTETADDYIATLRSVKARYGAVKSSAYISSKSSDLGEKLNVVRETTFEKGTAQERFLFKMQGDQAVLLGYVISAKDLLK